MKNHERRKKKSTGITRPTGPLETLGTVSVRTAVGDGARRLQSRWCGMGLFPARSCALPRLSVGRGWYRRDFGPASTDLLRAGHVEWTRSHSQRAGVRSDRPWGGPRRRRQGILLLSRLHTDALVPEGSVQVSTTRISLPRAGRRES